MSTENEGPLSKLSRLLGLDAEYAPIAAVKRIEETPVRLNAETLLGNKPLPDSFKMAPAPELCGDETINRLWEGGPSVPSEITAEFLSTKKRHRPDIYECRRCNYQFPQEASCPECGSADMALFMRAPSPSEIRPLRNHEGWLTDHDPDWRERFCGDADRALDFYCPQTRAGRVIHSSPFEPPTVVDDYRDPEE